MEALPFFVLGACTVGTERLARLWAAALWAAALWAALWEAGLSARRAVGAGPWGLGRGGRALGAGP